MFRYWLFIFFAGSILSCAPTPRSACENECERLFDCGELNDVSGCQAECSQRVEGIDADSACEDNYIEATSCLDSLTCSAAQSECTREFERLDSACGAQDAAELFPSGATVETACVASCEFAKICAEAEEGLAAGGVSSLSCTSSCDILVGLINVSSACEKVFVDSIDCVTKLECADASGVSANEGFCEAEAKALESECEGELGALEGLSFENLSPQ